MGLWERYAVPALVSCACSAKPITKQREKIVPHAEGVVLELGCGSGTNFKFYDPEKVTCLHALEPAPGMIRRAHKTAEKYPISDRVQFIQHGAEDIPLEDNSVDTVIITFVLCTIPDWSSALLEVRRVLKPGGRVLFTEHGLAPDENVAKWQRRIEPIWKPLAGGCHLTRDIQHLFRTSGFGLKDADTMYLPSTPKIAGFVSWGSAIPT
ncbi:MAG: class I SAM-dependent methyltransferase [Pseudomonadota bacterium]